MRIPIVAFFLTFAFSARLYAANPTGVSQTCRPAVPDAKIVYCMPTESGPLAISEVDWECKYVITLAGSVVMKTDCHSDNPSRVALPSCLAANERCPPYGDTNPNSEFPIIGEPLLVSSRLGFNGVEKVVVFEQYMGGNACGDGPLRFLRINRPTAPVKYVLSDIIPQCDNPSPVFTLEPHRIRVTWPDDPEVWVYEGGQVHRQKGGRTARPAPPRLGAPLGKTLEGETNWMALKWWAGEYPIDDVDLPERDFFKVPEVHEQLIKLLGVQGYERLQRDFGLVVPVDVISGYLVLTGGTSPRLEAAEEGAAVVVQLGTGKLSVFFRLDSGKMESFNTQDIPAEVRRFLCPDFFPCFSK